MSDGLRHPETGIQEPFHLESLLDAQRENFEANYSSLIQEITLGMDDRPACFYLPEETLLFFDLSIQQLPM